MREPIYLDANATTPVLQQAAEAACRMHLVDYGNPSSSHAQGQRARACLDAVRERAGRIFGARQGRMLFTSGATEAIQTAVLSALCAVRVRQQAGEDVGCYLVYGATEHKAVPEALAHWNSVLGTGLALMQLPVDADGLHDLTALHALAPEAALVCTMAANNETGVVSRLDAIAEALRVSPGPALWLVDCVQAPGKLALDLDRLRIDYAAFSGHKLYAPKGVGMLYVRDGAPFTPLVAGGGQERGARSGTENLPGIAALGVVLEALESGNIFRSAAELRTMRDQFAASLRAAFPGVVFNAPFSHALPTTLNFSVPGHSSAKLLDLFDGAGIALSGGSACSSVSANPSHVLEAMGLSKWQTTSAVRLSFGPAATGAWVAQACERIAECGVALREMQALPATRAVPQEELAVFLLRHPDAQIVDVRDHSERVQDGNARWSGRVPTAAPLDELAATHMTAWMVEPDRVLIFVCRSGIRAARAAANLHALGHRQVWYLAGDAYMSADAMTDSNRVRCAPPGNAPSLTLAHDS